MQVVRTDPMTEPLWESQREINRVQAEQLRMLVDYVESFLREAEVVDPHLMSTAQGRGTAESAAIMNAAEALTAGEGHVCSQYQQARFARQNLPAVWARTRRGDIPVRSLLRVVSAAERLVSPASVERMDREAEVYATSHRPAQLNAWLNRFVARVEPEQQAQRCHRNHAERRVWLEHVEDGLSILHAMLPTLTAEAIKNRLVEVARSPKQPVPYDPCVEPPSVRTGGAATNHVHTDWLGLPSGESSVAWDARSVEGSPDARHLESSPKVWAASQQGASRTAGTEGADPRHKDPGGMSRTGGDDRTQGQREADLLSHWLLIGQVDSDTPINGHIGLLISAESLIEPREGSTRTPAVAETPAVSRNRRHAYPAEMIRRIVQADHHRLTWTQVPEAFDHSTPLELRDAGGSGEHLPKDGRPGAWPPAEARPGEEPPDYRPLGEPPPALGPPHGHPQRGDPSVTGSPPEDGPVPVLERVYQSRFVPRLLRRAIEFRDGTCQAPGCMVAAEHCDIDHQIPWPHGQTTGANLWALCRKHHRLKTAGFLDVPAVRLPLRTT
ncbi:HNH endonuclease signature motif containing protein [Nesterenkonia lutea]|uniref:HNH nuclease domain-containing protein n=1 Tax=Nesterenkonia lutea TaxID=272919 RepID=A0ABR9JH66_9MICC|nr:HNH endonuclease signature motif containing protein [Nesterenkonia lutea]MBE1524817.1 hypothetical protein [Nesterenkonia lutea]